MGEANDAEDSGVGVDRRDPKHFFTPNRTKGGRRPKPNSRRRIDGLSGVRLLSPQDPFFPPSLSAATAASEEG